MLRRPAPILLGCFLMSLAATLAPAGDAPPAKELPLLLKEDFEKGADRWQPLDPMTWKIVATPKGNVFSQFARGKYKPPVRSPENFALLKDIAVGDFVLDARVRSTIKDYDHRDAVVVFGYQDPKHFYYVHFGKKTDDRANQIFIVNDAPRARISAKTTSGTPWTDDWHHVRVVRSVTSGSIEVYFDNMNTPAMTATNKMFSWGQIGIGTFDDTSDWDDIVLRGVRVEKK